MRYIHYLLFTTVLTLENQDIPFSHDTNLFRALEITGNAVLYKSTLFLCLLGMEFRTYIRIRYYTNQ